MSKDVLLIIGLLWFSVTLCINCVITSNINEDNYKSGCLIALKDFLIKLFIGKNWFGIILGVIVFIIAIPAMLLILMAQIIIYIGICILFIWKLGNKK